MKKLLLLLLCIQLTGCALPPVAKSRLVTGIQIEASDPTLCRVYTEPQKMETVLSYIRGLAQRKPARTDPERFSGVHYKIRLYYSDGNHRHIFQRADRFISEDYRPWQEVDQRYGSFLESMLRNMESD